MNSPNWRQEFISCFDSILNHKSWSNLPKGMHSLTTGTLQLFVTIHLSNHLPVAFERKLSRSALQLFPHAEPFYFLSSSCFVNTNCMMLFWITAWSPSHPKRVKSGLKISEFRIRFVSVQYYIFLPGLCVCLNKIHQDNHLSISL